MSKNRITKMFLMGLVLILTGIVCMLGVMAITDSKLVNFKLGTKYEPAFNIEVYTTTIYNQNESKSLVFKSVNPSEVNYNAHYIDSVTNDTILFKTENLKTDNGVVVLTVVNNENKSLQAIINKGAQVEVIDAGAEKAISVEIGTTNLGLFLFSLQIVEYAPYGASYNLSGCSLISGPEIIASETITSEIILQANDADNTKWTISATSGEIETEYIWQSALMQVKILLKNVTEATTLTAKAEIDYWDGTAEAFPYGNGTEENPYLIRNGKHLHYLADITNAGTGETLNKHYKMMNNIYLNEGTFGIDNETDFNATYNGSTTIPATVHQWEPIGVYIAYTDSGIIKAEYAFQGIFDGDNHKIIGLYTNNDDIGLEQGLFGGLSAIAEIKNLGVENSYVRSGHSVGNIVGGYSFGTIDNCYNKAYAIGRYFVGGICGSNYGIIKNCCNEGLIIYNSKTTSTTIGAFGGIAGESAGYVYNCYNSGKVIGGRDVAGIVGAGVVNSANVNIRQDIPYAVVEDCYNLGNIINTGEKTGGVVGVMHIHVGTTQPKVINCANSGEINGTGSYVAGVVGQNTAGEITNCHNTGAVTGGGSYVGGVCGYSTSKTITNTDSTTTTYTPTISNCWNSGEINGTGSYTGGVVGDNTAGEITNCHNTGAVTGGVSFVGGVCGSSTSKTITNADSTTTTYTPTISNCWNSGEINGTGSYVGGVVGNNNGGTIEYCYNQGNVVAAVSYASGICSHNVGQGIINFCYNEGDIRSNNAVGGVVGIGNSGIIKNSYNIGMIVGNSDAGGVFGSYAGSGSILTNCFNAGAVCVNRVCGGISGNNVYTKTAEINTIKYCYNTGMVTSGSSAYGTGGIVGYDRDGSANATSLGGAVNNCINTGKIKTENICAGGVLGTPTDNITAINSNFYLSGCAKDGNDVVQNGIGNTTKGSTTADISGRTNVLTSAQNGARMIFDYTGEPYSATVNSNVFLANSNTLATALGVGNYLFKYNGSTWDFYRSDFGGMYLVATGIPTSTLTSTTSGTGYGITFTGTLTPNAVVAIFAVKL